jgi:hypothetical protein
MKKAFLFWAIATALFLTSSAAWATAYSLSIAEGDVSGLTVSTDAYGMWALDIPSSEILSGSLTSGAVWTVGAPNTYLFELFEPDGSTLSDYLKVVVNGTTFAFDFHSDAEGETLSPPGGGDTIVAVVEPDVIDAILFSYNNLDSMALSVMSDVDVVPLPPSAFLLGSGLIGLAVTGLRKRWSK